MIEIGNQGEKEIWPSLDWATWWFDRASIGLIIGTLIVLISTALIVWMGVIKEHHWDALRDRTAIEIASTQGEAARANEAAGKAHERAAVLEADAATARHELATLQKDAESARAAIAEANARAAEANQKAEEERLARVKIEARIAPRGLSQKQQNELSEKLKAFKNQRGTITTSPVTPESEWFMRVLTAPLREAEWDIEMIPGTNAVTVLQPTGVVIGWAVDLANPRVDPKRSAAADALASALMELGIDATAVPAMLQPPTTVAITITPK